MATKRGKASKAARKKPAKSKSPKKTVAKKATKAVATKQKRANLKQTMPGGSAPKVDDVTRARHLLRELHEIVEQGSDADVQSILGDGTLERLLGSLMPAATKRASIHEHLLKHKRRASLLARLRHGINDESAFELEGSRFISPTRVQWFYDGLTFLEGDAPYQGVVGLFRDGVVRYGLGVQDVTSDQSLGPLASDFVSVAEAKRSFRSVKAAEGLARLRQMQAKAEDDPALWTSLLVDHPWMLGAQHSAITHVGRHDADLPKLTAKRTTDGAHDVLIVQAPSTGIVGKTNKVLVSFRDIWTRAERLRTFVQRQAGYLKRELGMKIQEPRFLIVAGQGLTAAERDVVRREMEMHFAAVRLTTYDELRSIAERTWAFFGSQI